jgi:hypothetical protein
MDRKATLCCKSAACAVLNQMLWAHFALFAEAQLTLLQI